MFELKHTYAINIHVMWYEADILPLFLHSLSEALKNISNPQNVTLKLYANMSQEIEQIDTAQIGLADLYDKIERSLRDLMDKNPKLRITEQISERKYSMIQYRREATAESINRDYIIWGETDCLLPSQFFTILDQVKDIAISNDIHRYVTTFATRKMWDASWRPIEHVDFTNCPFYEKSDPKAWSESSSIRYTMPYDEMERINAKYAHSPQIEAIRQPIFDGSILCLSNDLVKAGVNIPLGIRGISGEDAAMMQMCRKIMGNHYIQFIIRNILKVHNREHPEKRKWVLNSTQQDKGDLAMSYIKEGKDTLQRTFFEPQSKI